jgi:hypothetical protein
MVRLERTGETLKRLNGVSMRIKLRETDNFDGITIANSINALVDEIKVTQGYIRKLLTILPEAIDVKETLERLELGISIYKNLHSDKFED